MKVNESSSGSSSDATSTSEQHRHPQPQNDAAKKPKETTETEFLAKQAQDAKLAMTAAWQDAKRALASGVDVRLWTKQYPWLATGTALAAGVAAGYLLTPRDKDEFKEMWEKLKDKLAGAKADADAVFVEAKNGAPAPHQPSMLASLLKEALKAGLPIITSMIGGAVGAGSAASENGHKPTTDQQAGATGS
jgi:hypothetical protein